MKKSILPLLIILACTVNGFSQEYSYGLKGGINQSMGGVITGESSGEGYWAETLQGTGKMGFQFGAYGEIGFGRFFVRPEVVYNSIERQWDFPVQPAIHAVEKLDIPLLVGYNIWGPLDVYAGPVYSNVINSTMEGEEDLEQVVVQNSAINAQVGIKAEFGRFGIGLRYEHSLSSKEVQGLNFVTEEYGVNKAYYEDSAIDLVKVNVTFKIGGSDTNSRRRGYCY